MFQIIFVPSSNARNPVHQQKNGCVGYCFALGFGDIGRRSAKKTFAFTEYVVKTCSDRGELCDGRAVNRISCPKAAYPSALNTLRSAHLCSAIFQTGKPLIPGGTYAVSDF
jgi:hypothetical protein